jgi:hypothetical protein
MSFENPYKKTHYSYQVDHFKTIRDQSTLRFSRQITAKKTSYKFYMQK